MVHSAYKAPHQCRWKFRRSSCQIIFIGLHCASYPKEEHSDIRRQVDCVKQAVVMVVIFNPNKKFSELKENMTGIYKMI